MPTFVPAPTLGLRTVHLGRLGLAAVEDPITESLGSDVAASGDATAVGARRPKGFTLTFDVHDFDGTVAAGNTMRRQLRSLMQNHPLRLGGLYLSLSPDPERNGWLVIGSGELEDADGGVTFGSYKLALSQAFLVAAIRTHREGFRCDVTDLRLSTSPRDYLGQVLSTDFAALPNLPLFYLPPGAADVAVLDSRALTSAQQAGRDGACLICAGRSNGDVVSWDRPESSFNTGDVVVYDRRGQITAPAAGPDALWEEVYGPDYPWNWLTAGQPQDTPVLDNGLVRVRWDGSNTPGFRVDVWTPGTGYVEQGKVIVERLGDVTGFCDTLLSATLVEYSFGRAVVQCVLANSADANSRESVYLTVQRGAPRVAIEVYPALKADGVTKADALLAWTPALNAGIADLNNSVVKIDGQGSGNWVPSPPSAAQIRATAGTGAGTGNSSLFPSGSSSPIGNSTLATSENWLAILRCPTAYNVIGAYQTTLVMLQAAGVSVLYRAITNAYGILQNSYFVVSRANAGYVQCQVQFSPTQADQVLEAEAMTLGTGTTTTADAAASGGTTTTATRATDTNPHVSRANWPNGFGGVYRVFARVRVSTGSGVFLAKTAATAGSFIATSSTSYVWLDLGDVIASGTLEIHALNSTGAVFVDRIEAVLVQDRTRTGAQYSGARDQAQAALAMCLPQIRRPARAPV